MRTRSSHAMGGSKYRYIFHKMGLSNMMFQGDGIYSDSCSGSNLILSYCVVVNITFQCHPFDNISGAKLVIAVSNLEYPKLYYNHYR